MRIKGGKSREQLVNAVLRGDIQLNELPSSIRGSVENKVAKIKEQKAKAEAEAEAAVKAKLQPKKKAKTSGKVSKTGSKVSSKPRAKAGKK